MSTDAQPAQPRDEKWHTDLMDRVKKCRDDIESDYLATGGSESREALGSMNKAVSWLTHARSVRASQVAAPAAPPTPTPAPVARPTPQAAPKPAKPEPKVDPPSDN